MKIAVTGANGLFGRGLVQVFREAHSVYPLTRAEADLTHLDQARRALLAVSLDTVIHTAAIPDPDLCEREPDRAFQANVVATRNVVAIAKELGLSLAQISTDAVFDGTKTTPYTEEDKPNPISVYGKTKLLAEAEVATLQSYWIFRISVVFGPGKDNFVSKGLRTIKSGGTYTVAADQVGSATYSLDAAHTIMQVMAGGNVGLFHLSNQGVCSRLDLAQQAVICAGLPPDRVIGRPLAEMGRPAPRPKYAVMEMNALKRAGISPPRSWQAALTEYVNTYLLPLTP